MDTLTRDLSQSMLIAISAYMEKYPELALQYLKRFVEIFDDFVNHSESYNQSAIKTLYTAMAVDAEQRRGLI